MKNTRIDKIAIGAAQFGMDYGIANNSGQVSSNKIKEILKFSEKTGIKTIDTAFAYGNSEESLGLAGVEEFQIITKAPPGVLCKKGDDVIKQYLNQSLSNLKCRQIHGYLMHDATDLLGKDGDRNYKNLLKEKVNGRVKKIGVSVYQPEEIRLLLQRYELDIIQAPFNIMDNRLIESGVMDELHALQTELHVRSVFLQGLLLMNKRDRPKTFDRWDGLWNVWDEWLKATGMTAVGACLNYALSFKEITKVIVGVDSLQQLSEIHQSISLDDFFIPNELLINDKMLLNPANWKEL